MARHRPWFVAGLIVLPVVWSSAVAWVGASGRQRPLSSVSSTSGEQVPVSAATCATCHTAIHDKWANARHSKMLQPASGATVLGSFAGSAVTLRGKPYTLSKEGDAFYIRGPFPGSREEVHKVEFTLGSRRVQHYLTRLADGRLVVLPPTWDVEKNEWFHNLDIVNPRDADRNHVQVWNSSCLECHVSGASKGFDSVRLVYDTRWTDFGTSCERCHGPGAAHVAKYQAQSPARGGGSAITTPARVSSERSTMICAQCHSLRDVTVAGFNAGDDYYDHFTPVLEYAQTDGPDPAYWPDGRPRRFSNDAIGLWQSQCFLKGGATCITCHRDPHEPNIDRNPLVARSNNATCISCHSAIGAAGTKHTRHAAGSAGSACVACHMPRTVVSLRTRMPDHTIGVPAPENTTTHNIPNACTECHQDRHSDWAANRLAEWYPNGVRQRGIRRADTFALARRGERRAVDGLIRIATDDREPPLIRANAVGYLRRFPDARTETYLAAAASSDHPAVRLSAVLGLGEPGFTTSNVSPILINALSDQRRIVRIGAALSLMNSRITTLEGPAADLLERAKADYIARGSQLSDDARVLLDVGKFHLMNKDAAAAIRTLETSLRLDVELHASRYFLALAVLSQGRTADARALLSRIPKSDPYAEAAMKLLASLPGGGR